MSKLNTEFKIIRLVFRSIAILVLTIGLFFSYLVAELGDAPGLILIGTTIALVGTMLIYGLGEIVIDIKRNCNLAN